MSGSEVESQIRDNCPWAKLPQNVQQILGGSQREYEKQIVEYSVKNQLRYQGNLIRHVKKKPAPYYELLLQYSRDHLMLFPYHLSDIIVRELRYTPFSYYVGMMQDLMAHERSYDSLPNFTAVDCLRLLGIGRNQYIELMNKSRFSKKLGLLRRRPLAEHLPSCPIPVRMEPWWYVLHGYIMDDDIKACTVPERKVIDLLIDSGKQRLGALDAAVVEKLYSKGIVFLMVPVESTDQVSVPPLDGFVMNRLCNDYFEQLLYKIFVAIDEHTTLEELSRMLDIDLSLVKNAVSLFLRLSMAQLKGPPMIENLNDSWRKSAKEAGLSSGEKEGDLIDLIESAAQDAETPLNEAVPHFPSNSMNDLAEIGSPISNETGSTEKRLAFLFDSTVTAFLMMGNLSNNLKSHAVTLFEVGKLTDETLDKFLDELHKATLNAEPEGETRKYIEKAHILYSTVQQLRSKSEVDLIRSESLSGLEPLSRWRMLQRKYKLLISMAPLSQEIVPVNCINPPHLGPPVAEANSPWFKLFLYRLTGTGPTSLLLTKGTRLRRIPKCFLGASKLLINSWAHDPGAVLAESCLSQLNETLQHSAVFVQLYASAAEVVHVPFPITDLDKANENKENFSLIGHPSLKILADQMDINQSYGYVTFVRLREKSPRKAKRRKEGTPESADASVLSEGSMSGMDDSVFNTSGIQKIINGQLEDETIDPRYATSQSPKLTTGTSMVELKEGFRLFDCVFGLPLFDRALNAEVLSRFLQADFCEQKSLEGLVGSSQKISKLVIDFIAEYQPKKQKFTENQNGDRFAPYPTRSLIFENGKVEYFNP